MMNHPSSYSADSIITTSCHGHSFPCSSLVPCNHCHHFQRFWDLLYGLFRLGLGTEVHFWSHFQIHLTGEFWVFPGPGGLKNWRILRRKSLRYKPENYTHFLSPFAHKQILPEPAVCRPLLVVTGQRLCMPSTMFCLLHWCPPALLCLHGCNWALPRWVFLQHSTCDNLEELMYLHEVWAKVREWTAIKKARLA